MGRPKLTPKQQLFVAEYLKDLNASQAALRAGYSKKTAFRIGQQNLQKTAIAEAISEESQKRLERINVDADYMLRRLHKEAEADLADIFYKNGGIKPIHEWPKIWRQGLVSGLDIEQKYIYEEGVKEPDGYVVKLKLSDRIKRLELLGRHVAVQAFKDRMDVNVTVKRSEAITRSRNRVIEMTKVNGKFTATG